MPRNSEIPPRISVWKLFLPNAKSVLCNHKSLYIRRRRSLLSNRATQPPDCLLVQMERGGRDAELWLAHVNSTVSQPSLPVVWKATWLSDTFSSCNWKYKTCYNMKKVADNCETWEEESCFLFHKTFMNTLYISLTPIRNLFTCLIVWKKIPHCETNNG